MAEGPGAAPHSCLQECLNADDSSNWGLLCNGTSLRLLHDNPALVKPAYVQVALDQVFEGGLFDEFAVVWLLLHASRFQRNGDNTCLLDGWKQAGQQSGERALEGRPVGQICPGTLEQLQSGFDSTLKLLLALLGGAALSRMDR